MVEYGVFDRRRVEILSLIAAGSFTHAAFGGESAGGEWQSGVAVCQSIPSGLVPLVAVQPAGSAGAITKSKFP